MREAFYIVERLHTYTLNNYTSLRSIFVGAKVDESAKPACRTRHQKQMMMDKNRMEKEGEKKEPKKEEAIGIGETMQKDLMKGLLDKV